MEKKTAYQFEIGSLLNVNWNTNSIYVFNIHIFYDVFVMRLLLPHLRQEKSKMLQYLLLVRLKQQPYLYLV